MAPIQNNINRNITIIFINDNILLTEIKSVDIGKIINCVIILIKLGIFNILTKILYYFK